MCEMREMDVFKLADKLEKTRDLTDEEFAAILECKDPEFSEYLAGKARAVREHYYGKDVYLRGLIEFTNYCKNNCRYCGIRRDNANAERYRLSEEEILSCCDIGYELGFRTFVLQGGEDPYFTDDRIVSIVRKIKERHPDCALTLSIGEREKESYRRFFEAGADRYLLRHETADKEHYEMLHPAEMSYDHRMQCLRYLRDIGYQVGCGMMVGSPGQTLEHLIKDLRFLQEFRPEMVGIGPFVAHHDTEYADHPSGTAEMTLRLLSVIRLLLPDVLLPATTALGTIDPLGREKGIAAGANVIMPDLSPADVRGKYLLYDNKICTGEEAAECIRCLKMRVADTGYKIVYSRGDHINRRNDLVYKHLAHALARGYTDLYYVNVDTDEFIEFHTDDELGVLSEARRGNDFFVGCERDAKLYVHAEDQEAFVKAMDRDFLREALSRGRVYELSYRRIKDGEPFYVKMKVSRMEEDDRFIVIAVEDIDELMRQRQAEERMQEERVVYARLHALTGNFIVVYVVDPETGNYHEFSATDDYAESFDQAKAGTDFFTALSDAARIYGHPDDLGRVLPMLERGKIMGEIRRSGIFTLGYRIMMEGRPVHVEMKAAMVEEKDGPRLIVGLNENDAQYRQKENVKEITRQKEIFDLITGSLAEQYDTLYYIDIETSTYIEISSTDEYKKLNVPATGNDFFAEARRSIRKYVHHDDQEKALSLHYKDVMQKNLKNRNSFSMTWRLVVDGKVRHIRHTEIMARDRKHIIVCIENIDAEVQAELALKADKKKSVTYTQIAERLADHYDLIYYIDCKSSEYAEFSTKRRSGELKIQEEGRDFFESARKNMDRLIYSEDRSRIRLFLDRDNLISQLENSRQLTEDYRLLIGGGKTQYMRMSVTYSTDHSHFIICVESREEEVRREKEHLEALSMANAIARRDELTHTKNKTAYHEMESELQRIIDEGGDPFGIVVCDINGLKLINDTKGHKAGDDYIRSSCMLICRTFKHSPVFRIGGDEFAAVLRGSDYEDREKLVARLRKQVEENVRIGEGPVIASGMAEYEPGKDHLVEDVFNRADVRMYEVKTHLREQKLLQESHSLKDKAEIRVITEERRIMLDSLFKSFEVVSDGTYVYLCDMRYDYSRWSKNAVDAFGLPSEYMYGAGDIWENHIHPEDREAYHKGIEDIFAGSAAGHDMQYRALRTNGEYDVCTCRGVVIRDAFGEPEYFAGSIRNHGIQGHIDTLTGFRNQYGFFEDLDSCLMRNTEVSVVFTGISRFSEINEMYGYRFGNRVLQTYARKAYETVGNTGHIYRIDGTKFAVISNTLSIEEIEEAYNSFRAFLHDSFEVDGRKIILDLHAGAIRVDHFDIDSQIVYSCLNYANEESKLRWHGDLRVFRNEVDDDKHQRLEKLHEIRASIMRGCEGFYLLYQPVVDAYTERLIGAEALLRWKNDRYGMVPPDQFIPPLEADPLFPELGEWIIREAVYSAGKVRTRHPDFVVNVNLSYTQMEKPDFVDRVMCILKEEGYPPENLCLEVTERCRLLDPALLERVLVGLKSRGIRIALDDFGTGFSSVGILKDNPIDIIKIDRSFVMNVEESETDRELVHNIAGLAAIFGSKVCVEGIETAGMRDVLRKIHVNSFQGYYYARPLPLEELLEYQ